MEDTYPTKGERNCNAEVLGAMFDTAPTGVGTAIPLIRVVPVVLPASGD